jgi:Domain of unknown function (DUF6431)
MLPNDRRDRRVDGSRPAVASRWRESTCSQSLGRVILFQLSFLCSEARLRSAQILAGHSPGGASIATILFIPLSEDQINLEVDWAADCGKTILRRCPLCERDSIIGHGRRLKQAHDRSHDWIEIRRGICNCCGTTFTFLPTFSLPYTHYSLLARSEALRHYFAEHCSWESSAPTVLNANRVADPSTLRRWFRKLDCSRPPFSHLRRMMQAIRPWLDRAEVLVAASLSLRWHTTFAFLSQFWPLRL